MNLTFDAVRFRRLLNRLAALHARPPFVTTLSESTRFSLHRPKEKDLSSLARSLSGMTRRSGPFRSRTEHSQILE